MDGQTDRHTHTGFNLSEQSQSCCFPGVAPQSPGLNARPGPDTGHYSGLAGDRENEVPLLGKKRETHLEWEKPRNGVLEALGHGLS